MKKYSVLVAITLVVILTFYFGGNLIKSQIPEVDVLLVQEQEVQNSITCSGQLEPSDSKNVYLSEPLVAQEVLVQVGDRVDQGEDLLRVKKWEQSSEPEDEPEESSSMPDLDQLSQMTGMSKDQVAQVYNQYIKGNGSSASSSSKSAEDTSSDVDDNDDGEEVNTITAPVSGIISEINLKGNGTADNSKPVMVISDANSMQVRLSVNESQISSVEIGQKVNITGVGFHGSQYSGTVKSIANVATQTVSTTGQETVVEVIVTVDQAGEDLKSGLSAKCEIITSNDDGMLLAPYESVRAEDDGQEFIFLYRDGKAVKQIITTGREFADGFEVLSGLQAEDLIITNPDRLHTNSRVIVKNESKSVVSPDA